jgi:hypothetical protein
MNNKEKLDFYKELYDKEDLRRQEVYSALNIPIAFFSALVSAVYFFISKFNYETESFLKIVFLIFISLSIIALIVTLYFLLKANTDIFRGYIYSTIPASSDLIEYNKTLREHYETNFNDPDKGEEEFEKQLTDIMSENADFNNYINEKRHSYVYVAKQFLVIAVLFLILCLIPFGYNKMNLADNSNVSTKTTPKTDTKNELPSIEAGKLEHEDKSISNQNIIIIEGSNHQVKSTKTKKEIYLNDQVIIKDTCINIKILKNK